jgi:GntR family transcriptional repressor for pyruvate dehydrogenase complex
MLKPIKHQRVVDLIYEQIRDLIFRGRLRPGERLMPERKMANSLKVGRPAIREAIQKLIENNLVETRRGSGTFVTRLESQKQPGPFIQLLHGQEFTVQEFLEVRMALECNGAALAAKRATEEDLQLLENNIKTMKEEVLESPENRALHQDLSFHLNISYATHNIVQISLMKSFYDFMLSGMQETYPTLIRIPGLDPFVMQQHIMIFNAIREHNPNLAQDAMSAHINTIMEYYSETTHEAETSGPL